MFEVGCWMFPAIIFQPDECRTFIHAHAGTVPGVTSERTSNTQHRTSNTQCFGASRLYWMFVVRCWMLDVFCFKGRQMKTEILSTHTPSLFQAAVRRAAELL